MQTNTKKLIICQNDDSRAVLTGGVLFDESLQITQLSIASLEKLVEWAIDFK